MYDPTNYDNRGSPGDAGYSLVGGMFLIIAIFAGIFVGVGAIAGALVLSGLTRLVAGRSVPFKQAYKIAFWGITAWLAVTVALSSASDYVSYMMVGGRTQWNRIHDENLLHLLALLLPAHLPGIMACAAVMRGKLPGEYGGVAGFVIASFVSVVVVAISIVCSAVVILAAINGLLEANGHDTSREIGANMRVPPGEGLGAVIAQLLQLWAAAFGFALIGGLIAGVVLMGYAVLQRNAVSYRRAYGAAFLALLAWALGTIIVEFGFGTVSPFIKWLLVAIRDPQQLINDVGSVAEVQILLQGFLVSQIPGLLAAAHFVGGQIHQAKPGFLQYASALVAGAVAANAAIVAIVAGVALMSGNAQAM
jgi:hypothetical protein